MKKLRPLLSASGAFSMMGFVFSLSRSKVGQSGVGLSVVSTFGVMKIVSTLYFVSVCLCLKSAPSSGMSPNIGTFVTTLVDSLWRRPPSTSVWPFLTETCVLDSRVVRWVYLTFFWPI